MEKSCYTECKKIARLLKEERKRRGLSRYGLAKLSGLSQQAVGYMEKGERIPSLETVLRISKALDIDLVDLIRKRLSEA